MKKIHQIFTRMDRYKMEIFTFSFVSVTALLIVFMTTGFIQADAKTKVNLSQQAVYTTSVKSTLSNQPGTVDGVYVSNDRTRGLVMLKMDRMTNLSTDADNYFVQLVQANTQKRMLPVKGHVTPTLIVYGDTGHIGVMVEDPDGIQPQILQAAIRSKKILTDYDPSKAEKYTDANDARNDTISVYFNPAASDAEVINALDNKAEVDPMKIYMETVAVKEETKIRESLSEKIRKMKIMYDLIQEKTERLARDGIAEIEMPDEISGDQFVLINDDFQSAGEAPEYEYVPNMVLNQGFDFDWRSLDLQKSYLKAALGDYVNSAELFAAKNAEIPSVMDLSNLEWKLLDGTTVESVNQEGSVSTQYARLTSTIDELKTAWKNYFSAKQVYQSKDLKELLILEDDLSYLSSKPTVNSSEDMQSYIQ